MTATTAASMPELTTTIAAATDAPTVLFIHGFLDDATFWDDVVGALGDRVATVRYDLPGFGARTGELPDPSKLTRDVLTAETASILDGLEDAAPSVGGHYRPQSDPSPISSMSKRASGVDLVDRGRPGSDDHHGPTSKRNIAPLPSVCFTRRHSPAGDCSSFDERQREETEK